jgi:hypothetical protein
MGANGMLIWVILAAVFAAGYLFARMGDSGDEQEGEARNAPPAMVRRDRDGE